MSNIREVRCYGTLLRGPMPTNSAGPMKWKITALLPSSKRSTSGREVGASWQTWQRYKTREAARDVLDRIAEQEGKRCLTPPQR
jgi:hypothetical protein